jgi:3-dehydroquinate dehydratase-2
MTNILIINGPNLNMLDKRDKAVYGDSSLQKIEQNCRALADEIGLNIEFKQSNLEGEIIELIQNAIDKFDGIVINAAAYTHTSVAIRDALEIFTNPKIEIHISNIFNREEFRKTSLISDVVDGIISGFGVFGYEIAIRGINNIIKGK